jgi:GT2 family glycosyltransferase
MQTIDPNQQATDIVIVTWNSESTIGFCLEALRRRQPAGTRLIVVDNGSGDSTVALLASYGDEIFRLVTNRMNCGFAAACNLGARQGSAPTILFLNPDCEVREKTISSLLGFLAAHPEMAAAGACLVDREGKFQRGFAVRALPRWIDLCCEALLVNQVFPGNPWNKHYRMLNFPMERDGEIEQPAAACFMIRRSWFERLGGFDERFYPAWFEDVDLCKRLRQAHAKVGYCASAMVRHAGGSSVRSMTAGGASELFFLNMLRYSQKHWGYARTLILRWAVALGMLKRMVLVSFSATALQRYRRGGEDQLSDALVRSSLRKAWGRIFKGAIGQWRLL